MLMRRAKSGTITKAELIEFLALLGALEGKVVRTNKIKNGLANLVIIEGGNCEAR